MKKIIIIDHEPFTIRRKQIFYIDELREAGFDVEFWDCSLYLYKKSYVIENRISDFNLVQIATKEELNAALQKLNIDKTIVIAEVAENWKYREFFKLLNTYKISPLRMWMYSTAIIGDENFIEKLTPKRIVASIRSRFMLQMLKLYYKRNKFISKPYSCLITTGAEPSALRINHTDWEQYKEVKQFNPIIGEPYILFLDDYFPLHPDIKYFLGKDIDYLNDDYHSDLNRFFAEIEEQYKMPIVIAAHPKAEYSAEAFNNRRIIKQKTAKLVKDAHSVILHGSAAIAYAIMFDKPVMITTTEHHRKVSKINNHIKRLARIFNLPLYNISKNDQGSAFNHIEADKRVSYIYKYLTAPDIENKSNIDLLVKFFAQL